MSAGPAPRAPLSPAGLTPQRAPLAPGRHAPGPVRGGPDARAGPQARYRTTPIEPSARSPRNNFQERHRLAATAAGLPEGPEGPKDPEAPEDTEVTEDTEDTEDTMQLEFYN